MKTVILDLEPDQLILKPYSVNSVYRRWSLIHSSMKANFECKLFYFANHNSSIPPSRKKNTYWKITFIFHSLLKGQMILMQLNTTASSSSCFFYLSATIPEFKPSQHNTRSIAMSSSRCKKHRSQQEHLFLTLCQERSSAVLPPSLHLGPFSPGAVPGRCSCSVSRGLLRWAPCRGKDTLVSKGEMNRTWIGCKQQKAPRMGQGHD